MRGRRGTPREPTNREQQVADRRRDERVISEHLAERRRTVAQGLLAGLSQSEMARTLGIDKSVVCDDVKAIRDQWREDQNATYQEYVDQEIARLDRLTVAHWERAIHGNKDSTDLVLKISDRRTRILGLDAPERHKVEITDDRTVDEIAEKLAVLAATLDLPNEGLGEEAEAEGDPSS